MNGLEFLRLIADTRAFRQAAWLIEREIARLQVRGGDLSPVGGASGWPSHTVWECLKTANHFNLAIALELRLKCFLRLNEVMPPGGRDGHHLAGLYELLGAHGIYMEAELERLYRQAVAEYPFTLVAFLSTDDPAAVPEGPRNCPLQSLMDVFAYMDDDMELWQRQYAWEHAAEQQWQHYIDDLSALFAFLDTSESLAKEEARNQGIVR